MFDYWLLIARTSLSEMISHAVMFGCTLCSVYVYVIPMKTIIVKISKPQAVRASF